MLRIDMSSLLALAGGAGSLLELDFRVAEAAPGVIPLDLQWVQLNETHLTLHPDPVPGSDPTDGVIRLLGQAPAVQPSGAVGLDGVTVVQPASAVAAAPVQEPLVVAVSAPQALVLPELRFDRIAPAAIGTSVAGDLLPRKEWLGQWLQGGSGEDKPVKRSGWRLFAGRP